MLYSYIDEQAIDTILIYYEYVVDPLSKLFAPDIIVIYSLNKNNVTYIWN